MEKNGELEKKKKLLGNALCLEKQGKGSVEEG